MDKRLKYGLAGLGVVAILAVVVLVTKRMVLQQTTMHNSGNTSSVVNDYSVVEATQDNEYTMYSAIATGVAGIISGAFRRR